MLEFLKAVAWSFAFSLVWLTVKAIDVLSWLWRRITTS